MRPRLATKFLWTILGIVGLSILSSLVTLYRRIGGSICGLNRRHKRAFPPCGPEDVQIMIRERNGLLAAYLLGHGNAPWSGQLHALKPRFQNWVATVRGTTYVPDDEQA